MIFRAPAKINLGLHVKEKRPDGFHEIESVFSSIPLCDYVELIKSENDSFESFNIDIPGKVEDNLCLKALWLLREKGYDIPYYEISLLKNIPIGAGLGGGSSDAVTVIKAINRLENLRLSQEKLHELSAELGSDCPFFCYNSSALVTGRGENIKPIDFKLTGCFIYLVYPAIHISTKAAYGSLDLNNTNKSTIELPKTFMDFEGRFINDFEKPLAQKFPVLQRIKTNLNNAGAFYTSLSGSGSSMFGLFKSKPNSGLFKDENWKEWIFKI